MAYSLDLPQRAVKRVKDGHSVSETTALYEIGQATLKAHVRGEHPTFATRLLER